MNWSIVNRSFQKKNKIKFGARKKKLKKTKPLLDGMENFNVVLHAQAHLCTPKIYQAPSDELRQFCLTEIACFIGQKKTQSRNKCFWTEQK